MKIVVLSGGGRGDTQPYAALSCGFRRASHEVVFLILEQFTPLLEGCDVELYVSDIDIMEVFASQDAQELFSSGKNPIGFMRHFTNLLIPILEQAVRDLVEVCKKADALVLSSTHSLTGTTGVERLGIPYVAAYPIPMTPSWHYPSIMSPVPPNWMPGKQLYNRLTHVVTHLVTYQFLGRHHKRMMEQLPKPPSAVPLAAPVIYGISPRVFERPPDWPAHIQLTGYWFLDRPADWAPSKELDDFLASGDMPVYVGFGSMNSREPESATKLACQALERAGRRGILITGMGGLQQEELPDYVFAAESIPHDWLFKRVSAVVHHGGAGTTAAGLRAGCPTVCVPHMGDQFFWARRVHSLGVGPEPIPRKGLTVENLASAIERATSEARIGECASVISEQIRTEDGVSMAVELALQHFEAA